VNTPDNELGLEERIAIIRSRFRPGARQQERPSREEHVAIISSRVGWYCGRIAALVIKGK